MMRGETAEVRVFTRETAAGSYPAGLAGSVHISFRTGGKECPLCGNRGILFAQAVSDEEDVLHAKILTGPSLCRLGNGTFLITAERTEEDGGEDPSAAGRRLAWLTEDFCRFEELGLVEIPELCRRYGTEEEALSRTDRAAVPASLCRAAQEYWEPVRSVRAELPDRVRGRKALKDVRARVIYSDGSFDDKRIQWDVESCSGPGSDSRPDAGPASCGGTAGGAARIRGRIERPALPFPLTEGFADPVVLLWRNRYYYIATNDNLDDIGLYVRSAGDLEGLFAEGVQQHCILDRDEKRGLYQTFWAPEFHVIGGSLYLLFAVSGRQWGPQCHLMRLREGGDILRAEDWEDPIRVRRADGSFLSEDGITLDMTCVRSGERWYYIWSYRRHIGTDRDTGSMLMAAELDPDEPQRLAGEPVLLSRPLYSWENLCGTINNEGPCAFCENGVIYLTYSAGDACGYLYAVGLLTARDGADLADPASWSKAGRPVLTSDSVPGEYGPGHNSFFRDRDGKLWITYHAETSIESRRRCSGMRRIHIGRDGRPCFALSAEEDLGESICGVEIIMEAADDGL